MIKRRKDLKTAFEQKYPEHAKLRKDDHEVIVDFLEFMTQTGYEIRNPAGYYAKESTLVAEYFGIDEKEFAAEKDRMLEEFINRTE